MLIALTGTPGTGKSTIAQRLEQEGYRVAWIDELAAEVGALSGFDERRGAREVDLDKLKGALPGDRPLILVGHYAHLLPVDIAIVLRCHPETLRKRLEGRGWPAPKVWENLEAEAMGVIAHEAGERSDVRQVETTVARLEETLEAVRDILQGKGERYADIGIDWSEVILEWF